MIPITVHNQLHLVDFINTSDKGPILVDEEGCVFAKLAIRSLDKDEFVAKTYAENKGLCEQLVNLGILESTGRMVGRDPVLRVPQHEVAK